MEEIRKLLKRHKELQSAVSNESITSILPDVMLEYTITIDNVEYEYNAESDLWIPIRLNSTENYS